MVLHRVLRLSCRRHHARARCGCYFALRLLPAQFSLGNPHAAGCVGSKPQSRFSTKSCNRHRPTALVLQDWGKSHRFAGSGDRNAIGGDRLRCAAAALVDCLGVRDRCPAGAGARRRSLGARHARPRLWPAPATGRSSAPEPLSEDGSRRPDAPARWRPRPRSAPMFPSGCGRASCAPSARGAVEEGRKLAERAPTDSARQHAQGDAGEGPEGAARLRRRADALFAASACASPLPIAHRADAQPASRKPPSRPVGSRSRTRARRSPRCSPAPDRACRCSILCRRRRQDAGARRRDGEQGPDLRL